MPSYPLINGLRYDFSSIEVVVANKRFVGIKSIAYNDGLEAGLVRGTATQVLGRTRGQYNAEGNFEIYREDWDELLNLLVATSNGAGFYEVQFDLNVNYSELASNSIQNDRIVGCRIKKADASNTNGSDNLSIRADFHALYIVHNNKYPVGVAQQIGARF